MAKLTCIKTSFMDINILKSFYFLQFLFCQTVLILLFTFFLHVILINPIIYFPVFSPLSEGYIIRNSKFSWKSLIYFFAIASTKLWSLKSLKINFFKSNLENNLSARCFSSFTFKLWTFMHSNYFSKLY